MMGIECVFVLLLLIKTSSANKEIPCGLNIAIDTINANPAESKKPLETVQVCENGFRYQWLSSNVSIPNDDIGTEQIAMTLDSSFGCYDMCICDENGQCYKSGFGGSNVKLIPHCKNYECHMYAVENVQVSVGTYGFLEANGIQREIPDHSKDLLDLSSGYIKATSISCSGCEKIMNMKCSEVTASSCTGPKKSAGLTLIVDTSVSWLQLTRPAIASCYSTIGMRYFWAPVSNPIPKKSQENKELSVVLDTMKGCQKLCIRDTDGVLYKQMENSNAYVEFVPFCEDDSCHMYAVPYHDAENYLSYTYLSRSTGDDVWEVYGTPDPFNFSVGKESGYIKVDMASCYGCEVLKEAKFYTVPTDNNQQIFPYPVHSVLGVNLIDVHVENIEKLNANYGTGLTEIYEYCKNYYPSFDNILIEEAETCKRVTIDKYLDKLTSIELIVEYGTFNVYPNHTQSPIGVMTYSNTCYPNFEKIAVAYQFEYTQMDIPNEAFDANALAYTLDSDFFCDELCICSQEKVCYKFSSKKVYVVFVPYCSNTLEAVIDPICAIYAAVYDVDEMGSPLDIFTYKGENNWVEGEHYYPPNPYESSLTDCIADQDEPCRYIKANAISCNGCDQIKNLVVANLSACQKEFSTRTITFYIATPLPEGTKQWSMLTVSRFFHFHECKNPENSAGLTVFSLTFSAAVFRTIAPIAKCYCNVGVRYYWNAIEESLPSKVFDLKQNSFIIDSYHSCHEFCVCDEFGACYEPENNFAYVEFFPFCEIGTCHMYAVPHIDDIYGNLKRYGGSTFDSPDGYTERVSKNSSYIKAYSVACISCKSMIQSKSLCNGIIEHLTQSIYPIISNEKTRIDVIDVSSFVPWLFNASDNDYNTAEVQIAKNIRAHDAYSYFHDLCYYAYDEQGENETEFGQFIKACIQSAINKYENRFPGSYDLLMSMMVGEDSIFNINFIVTLVFGIPGFVFSITVVGMIVRKKTLRSPFGILCAAVAINDIFTLFNNVFLEGYQNIKYLKGDTTSGRIGFGQSLSRLMFFIYISSGMINAVFGVFKSFNRYLAIYFPIGYMEKFTVFKAILMCVVIGILVIVGLTPILFSQGWCEITFTAGQYMKDNECSIVFMRIRDFTDYGSILCSTILDIATAMKMKKYIFQRQHKQHDEHSSREKLFLIQNFANLITLVVFLIPYFIFNGLCDGKMVNCLDKGIFIHFMIIFYLCSTLRTIWRSIDELISLTVHLRILKMHKLLRTTVQFLTDRELFKKRTSTESSVSISSIRSSK